MSYSAHTMRNVFMVYPFSYVDITKEYENMVNNPEIP